MDALFQNGSLVWPVKERGDYVDNWFLMGSPYSVPLLVTSYLLFVLKIGPHYMKNRKPFNFKNVLIIYNLIQVLFSCYMFYRGISFIYKFGVFPSKCLMDYEDSKYELISGAHLYFTAKVTELLDTVFFVLRKNQRQVTFLHIYHHTYMLITSWLLLKVYWSDSLVFPPTLNAFVHIIMYGYYGLSAFPSMTKYLWWKKYITRLQLAQFAAVILQLLQSNRVSKCPPAHFLTYSIIFNLVLFVFLFSNFYIKTYIKSKNNIKDK